MNIYELIDSIWTGNSREITPIDGCPPSWVRSDIEPPVLSGTEVAKWIGKGWVILPEAPPRPLPVISATKWKFRRALNELGLRAMVETAVTTSNNQEIQDAWAYADVYFSNDPLALSLGFALGKTEAEIYAVFELANSYS